MAKSLNWWTRKLHRWGAVVCAIPLLVVIVSGLFLQVKKQVAWVQPPTQSGDSQVPEIEWGEILQASQKVAEADIDSWEDIDRIDVRIGKGVLKVRCKNGWEIQLDAVSGDVLSSEYRRSDIIESIHDGSFFSDFAKLWVFLPNGIVLLSLWFTGIYLWYLPYMSKRKKRKLSANESSKGQTD